MQPVQRPGAERQAQLLRGGQGGGDDLGDLLGGVGGGAATAGHVLEPVGPLGVEPPDPGGDGGAGDAELAGDGGGAEAGGGLQDDLGPLDDAGLRRAGAGQGLDGLALLGGQLTE